MRGAWLPDASIYIRDVDGDGGIERETESGRDKERETERDAANTLVSGVSDCQCSDKMAKNQTGFVTGQTAAKTGFYAFSTTSWTSLLQTTVTWHGAEQSSARPGHTEEKNCPSNKAERVGQGAERSNGRLTTCFGSSAKKILAVPRIPTNYRWHQEAFFF